MQQALIFNIQKFCIHDGPGIRTTVFFKGCPLHCGWCSNPESQSGMAQLLHNPVRCVNCRSCLNYCTAKAISFPYGSFLLDRERCSACGDCTAACEQQALSVAGKATALEEVVRVCLQDKIFYDKSGGGVTLSGGEPLLHAEFALSLLRELNERWVHTAVETTGCVAPETMLGAAGLTDLFLFDIKHYDSRRHREGTGEGNELILANFRAAAKTGVEILPRIPVIPGFNDSLDDARGFAQLLFELGAKRVQLLPFHQLGANKYRCLEREYAFDGKAQLHAEQLADYRAVLCDAGLDCFF